MSAPPAKPTMVGDFWFAISLITFALGGILLLGFFGRVYMAAVEPEAHGSMWCGEPGWHSYTFSWYGCSYPSLRTPLEAGFPSLLGAAGSIAVGIFALDRASRQRNDSKALRVRYRRQTAEGLLVTGLITLPLSAVLTALSYRLGAAQASLLLGVPGVIAAFGIYLRHGTFRQS